MDLALNLAIYILSFVPCEYIDRFQIKVIMMLGHL
jgi:hypothetical protein